MSTNNSDEGGCLKGILGGILVTIIVAFMYFVVCPIMISLIPFIIFGFIAIVIALAVISFFE